MISNTEKMITRDDNKTPLVSIIVPVYKVEKYLHRCLRSILAQSYQNFELILVDDGSPDKCGSICETYAEKDCRIKVMHQENQGQASARNNAVRNANGEFIVFVDSDDFVESDCIEYLLALQNKYQADVSIGGFLYFYDGSEVPQRENRENEVVLNAEEALIQMNYSKGFGATPWAKLYKKELILSHPFPVGQIYEDLATLYKIIGDSHTVAFGSRRIYYWVQREGSTMRSDFDERQMAGYEAVERQLAYVRERYPNAVPSAKARYMGKIIELMAIALRAKNSREVYKKLKNKAVYYSDVMRDPCVKTSQKIRLFGIKCGYLPTKIIFSAHERMKEKKFSFGGHKNG